MTKENEFNNVCSNNSTAIVTPQRCEIRISFSIPLPVFSKSVRSKLQKAVFVVTSLLVLVMSGCSALDVQLSSPWGALLFLSAMSGILYCCWVILCKCCEYVSIINEKEEEGEV